MIIKATEKDFTEHVKRICRSNIQKGIKICLLCPFRKDALEIMKKHNWKLPEPEKLKSNIKTCSFFYF